MRRGKFLSLSLSLFLLLLIISAHFSSELREDTRNVAPDLFPP